MFSEITLEGSDQFIAECEVLATTHQTLYEGQNKSISVLKHPNGNMYASFENFYESVEKFIKVELKPGQSVLEKMNELILGSICEYESQLLELLHWDNNAIHTYVVPADYSGECRVVKYSRLSEGCTSAAYVGNIFEAELTRCYLGEWTEEEKALAVGHVHKSDGINHRLIYDPSACSSVAIFDTTDDATKYVALMSADDKRTFGDHDNRPSYFIVAA